MFNYVRSYTTFTRFVVGLTLLINASWLVPLSTLAYLLGLLLLATVGYDIFNDDLITPG